MKKSTQSFLLTVAVGVAAYWGYKKFKAHQASVAAAAVAAANGTPLASPTGADAGIQPAGSGVVHGLNEYVRR